MHFDEIMRMHHPTAGELKNIGDVWERAVPTATEKGPSATFHNTRRVHQSGDDYPEEFTPEKVMSSAKAFGKTPVQNPANKPIGKTTKAVGPVPFSSTEAYEEYKKSIAYGETPTHKSGVYPYGKEIGTAPQTSESVKAGKYKTAQFMGKTVTKHKKPVLFSQYIPCQYIESSGTQYVATSITLTDQYKVECEYQQTEAGRLRVFGGRSTSTYKTFAAGSNEDSTLFQYGWGNNSVDVTDCQLDLNKHKVIFDGKGRKLTYDEKEITLSDSTFTAASVCYLFAIKGSTAIYISTPLKVFTFKVWNENSTLIADFVPVKDVVNNVYGMFDRVAETFYGNAGTGTFTGGDEIKPVSYLEGTGTQWIDTGIDYMADFEVGIKLRESVSNKAFGINNDWCVERYTAQNPTWNIFKVNTAVSITEYHILKFKNNAVYSDDIKLFNHTNLKPSGSFTLFTVPGALPTAYPNIIYFCKLWNPSDGTLIRDYVPVKIGTEYCMLDLINFQIYRNQGSGSFLGGPEIPTTTIVSDELDTNVGPIKYGYADLDVNIPSEYERVEYIQSRGTQYIDTGFTFENSTKIEFTITKTAPNEGYTDAESRGNVWFGNNGATGAELMLGWGAAGTTNYFRGSSSGIFGNWKPSLNTKYHIEFTYEKGNGQFYADGVKQGSTGTSTNSTDDRSILIGAVRDINASAPILYCKEKFHNEVKIWNGNTLLVHLIPVKKVSNNEYGMYDLVSGQFFGNSGTGAFTGPTETINREIYTTGTQEMSIKSKNLFDKSTAEVLTGYVSNTGVGNATFVHSGTSERIILFKCEPSTTYTISKVSTDRLCIAEFPSKPVVSSSDVTDSKLLYTDGDKMVATVTTDTKGEWLAIQVSNIGLGGSQPTLQDVLDSLQLEEGSAKTTYSPYFAPQTYSNKNLLLSATSYLDFASREIYKDWAIKVLDGTEDWGYNTSFDNWTLFNLSVTSTLSDRATIQTHGTGNSSYRNPDGLNIMTGSTNRLFLSVKNPLFEIDSSTTSSERVAKIKAYLAAEYAKGTPVIVSYPLATPTTTIDATLPEFTQNVGTSIIDNTDAYGVKQGVSVTGVNLNVTTPAPDKPLPLSTNAGTLYYSITATDTTKYPVALNGCNVVDLGTINYDYGTTFGFQYSGIGYKSNAENAFVDGYTFVGAVSSVLQIGELEFGVNPALGKMYFRDARYTDAASFKSAVSGKILLYELSTSDNSVWTAASNTQGDIGYLCTAQGTATTSAPLGTFVPAKGMTVASVNGVITDGEQKFEIKGKNLLNPDISMWESGVYEGFKVCNEDEEVYMRLFEKDPTVDLTGVYLGFTETGIDSTGGIIWLIINGNISSTGRTNSASGAKFGYVSVYGTSATGGTTGAWLKILARYDVMVVNGTAAPTSYEPYVTPYIGSIKTPLLSTNCYRDFSRKIDHNEWAIKVLDGTESWTRSSSWPNSYLSDYVITDRSYERAYLSSHFKAVYNSSEMQTAGNIYFGLETQRVNISMPVDICNSAEGFKAYLAAEYAAGHPVIIIYPLATPTETPITVTSPTQNAGTNTVDTVFADATHGNVEMDGIMQLQTVPLPESSLPIETSSGKLNWNSSTQELETDGEQKLILGSQGCVDMGTLTWVQGSVDGRYYTDSLKEVIKSNASSLTTQPLYCAEYRIEYVNEDKVGYLANNRVVVNDIAYATASEFKAAMSGKYLYYQRTTDTEFIQPKVVDIKTILLSADDYEDVNAKLAHNAWKAEVLDGTESWNTSAFTDVFSLQGPSWIPSDGSPLYCSHFNNIASPITAQREGNCWFKLGRCNIGWASMVAQGITAFKQWLASEYAAGHPVIVVYPLATATDTAVTTTPIALDKKANWIATNTTELGAGDVSCEYLGKEGVTYTITATDSHCSHTGPTSVMKGSTATLTYTAASGYTLDASCFTVSNATMSYQNGVLTLTNITGNVTVQATAVANFENVLDGDTLILNGAYQATQSSDTLEVT